MAKTFEDIDKGRTGPREGGSRTYDQDGNLISETKQDFGKKRDDVPAKPKPEKPEKPEKKSRRSAPEPTGGLE